MPLTATVDVANASVHLHLDYTSNPGVQVNARIFRRVGRPAAPDEYVRGLFHEDLLGEQAYLTDTEAPLDREIWYVALADGDPSTFLLSGPHTIPSEGYVWLKDPGRPWADLKLDLCADPTRSADCPEDPLVLDTFSRTVANGWGTADSGQSWTTVAGLASQYAVAAGAGTQTQTAASIFLHSIVPSTVADVDVTTEWWADTAPSGASNFVFLMARYTDTTHFYMARVQIPVSGTMSLTLRKRDGAETQLSGFFYDTLIPFVPGEHYRTRFRIVGAFLQVKMWRSAQAEPDSFQLFAADSALTVPGSTGVRTLVNTGSTSAFPVVFSFDNYEVTDPNAPVPVVAAWAGFGDKTRPADASVFHVLDRETPSSVYATRKDIVTSGRFLTRSLDAITSVYELFIAGAPVLLQAPEVYGVVPYDFPLQLSDKYFQPGDLDENYISRDQRKPWRLWETPLAAVTNPVGPPQGTDEANWCAVNASYFTYADLTATGYNWGQAMTGDASAPPETGLYGGGTYGGGLYGG